MNRRNRMVRVASLVSVVVVGAGIWALASADRRSFLESNSGAITVLFTFVVAIATVVYAILTASLVSETKRMRQATHWPQVVVRLDTDTKHWNCLFLLVENVGAGPAVDVKFETIQDFTFKKPKDLSKVGILQNGTSSLVPGQKFETFLTTLVGELEAEPYPTAIVRSSYKDVEGNEYSTEHVLNAGDFVGLSALANEPIKEIQKDLKRIADVASRWNDWSGRLRVTSYTSAEVEEELNEVQGKAERLGRRATNPRATGEEE